MNEELDELYLEWLYEQVGLGGPRDQHNYWNLLKHMQSKEFVWIVPNDDDRIQDGRALRYEFVEAARLKRVNAGWMGMGCSFLEMMIGLSRRLSFLAEGEPHEWFWHMLRNLRLHRYNDDYYHPREDTRKLNNVDRALDMVIWRTYDFDGKGGIFPLEDPQEDQTLVELWYQLNAYILERD